MTQRPFRHRALALGELLTILPVGGLILILAIPAMRQTRTLCQRTDCLTNMQRIGAAMLTYAAEDSKEQIVPIHAYMMVSRPYWEWRTVNWFAWGGDDATVTFQMYAWAGLWLSDVAPPPERTLTWRPGYGASTRPLNGYLADYPGVFHCPADTGYPDDARVDTAPRANAGRPCYDTLGNSYPANLCSWVFAPAGESPDGGHLAFGAWGHRLSTLVNTSFVMLFHDAAFNGMLGSTYTQPTMYGWHGSAWSDNVGYCDGSVRLTSLVGEHQGPSRRPHGPDGVSLDTPTICYPDNVFSGPTWQLDCYPTPGAVIWGNWTSYFRDCWPFKDPQQNLGGARGPGDDPPAPGDPVQLSPEMWRVDDAVQQTPETPMKPAVRGQTP